MNKKIFRQGAEYFFIPCISALLSYGLYSLTGRAGWSVLVFFAILFFVAVLAKRRPARLPYFSTLVDEHLHLVIYFSIFSLTFISAFAGSTIAENDAVQKHTTLASHEMSQMPPVSTVSVFKVIPDALDQTGVIFVLFAFLATPLSYFLEKFAIPSLLGYNSREGQRFDLLTGAPNISLRQQTVRSLVSAVWESDPSGAKLASTAQAIGKSFGENILTISDSSNVENFLKECGAADKKSCLLSLEISRAGQEHLLLLIQSRVLYNIHEEAKLPENGFSPCSVFVESYIKGILQAFGDAAHHRENYEIKPTNCKRNCAKICNLEMLIKVEPGVI